MSGVKLNLGAGNRRLDGYISVDLAQSADDIRDVRDLGNYADGSVDEIIAVHLIEHFYFWEVHPLLMEWRRVLKPGGKLILECPDLKKACHAFLRGEGESMGMWAFYGNPKPKDELMCHHWGYTPETLKDLLSSCGFRNIEEKPAQFKVPRRDMRMEAYK